MVDSHRVILWVWEWSTTTHKFCVNFTHAEQRGENTEIDVPFIEVHLYRVQKQVNYSIRRQNGDYYWWWEVAKGGNLT